MIHIITPFYNAQRWLPTCIKSIIKQTVPEWTLHLCNDCSTDKSQDICKHYYLNDKRVQWYNNNHKVYSSGNHWLTINLSPDIKDEDICIDVDGDDWLAHPDVFKQVLEAYENENTWMTYGSFVHLAGLNNNKPIFTQGFAQPPANWSALRKIRYTTTHLRTYKAGLFRKIQEQDLKDPNGDWLSMAGDVAFMYPMLEMCGPEHAAFLPQIHYIYNTETNYNEYKVNLGKQNAFAEYVRNKEPYKKLESL